MANIPVTTIENAELEKQAQSFYEGGKILQCNMELVELNLDHGIISQINSDDLDSYTTSLSALVEQLNPDIAATVKSMIKKIVPYGDLPEAIKDSYREQAPRIYAHLAEVKAARIANMPTSIEGISDPTITLDTP